MTGILGESGAKVDGWGMGLKENSLEVPCESRLIFRAMKKIWTS